VEVNIDIPHFGLLGSVFKEVLVPEQTHKTTLRFSHFTEYFRLEQQ